MVFAETTHFYSFLKSKSDNHYYNRLSKILKRVILQPLYLTFPELLPSGSFSIKV